VRKTNSVSFENVLLDLENYCRGHGWRGPDCYDGLNSRWFRKSPFYRSGMARTVWLQALKRSPFNLRPFLGIEPQDNPKALALFILGAVAREVRSPDATRRQEIRQLADRLVAIRNDDPRGGGWGYPFDWQSRAFFAGGGTPNIVATAFSGLALLAAHRLRPERTWLEAAGQGCRFIADHLAIVDETGESLFAYIVGDRSRIYNASLLGAWLLVEGGAELDRADWIDLGHQAARRVGRSQADDGSWPYGPLPRHRWVDSIHTGYNLIALESIAARLGTGGLDSTIAKGYSFYKNHFIGRDYVPRYYSNGTYPIDVHSAAVAILTFLVMSRYDSTAEASAEGVARWTIRRMRDQRRGFFYFQKHMFYTIRIPYMRWSQAWMYYALSLLTTFQAREHQLPARTGTVNALGQAAFHQDGS